MLQPAETHDKINVENEFEVEGELAQAEEIANTVAWDNLADVTKRRRLKEVARYMREQVLQFLRKWVHPAGTAVRKTEALPIRAAGTAVREQLCGQFDWTEAQPICRDSCVANQPGQLRGQSAGTAVQRQRCGRSIGTAARPICVVGRNV